jgi:hypothetical protein
MAGSPKINLIEKDVSTYVETAGRNITALVGFATKGPLNEPTVVISKKDFQNKFGKAPANFPYAHLAAYRYFDFGSNLLFTRVAIPSDELTATGGDADDAYEASYAKSALITTRAIGTSASIVGTTPVSLSARTIAFKIKVDGSDFYTSIVYEIPATTGYTVDDLVTALNEKFEAADLLVVASASTGGELEFTAQSYGLTSSLDISSINDDFALISVLGLADDTQNLDTGADGAANVNGEIQVRFLEVGTAGDLYGMSIVREYNNVTNLFTYNVIITKDDDKENPIELYEDVSFDSSSDSYFVKLVNQNSDLVAIEFPNDSEPSFAYIASADFDIALSGGDDGIPEITDKNGATAEEIGQLTSQLYVNAFDKLNNPELYDFDILATPGVYSQLIITKALALGEARKDLLYIVDSPNGLTYDQVAKWHNGTGGFGNTTSLNSSYGVLYWSWQKDYDEDNGEFVMVPPSVFMVSKFAFIDKEYAPWRSPAGLERGKILGSLDYEYSPDEGERDALYGGLNAVNPIVNFLTEGLVVFGQKTLLRELKATNRVNVRRLLIYSKKLIRKAMRGFLFEANNPDTWGRAANAIRKILEPIKQAGGISSYTVAIDGTANDASTIDQSQMNGVVSIVPTKEIEEINITFKILSTGAVAFTS